MAVNPHKAVAGISSVFIIFIALPAVANPLRASPEQRRTVELVCDDSQVDKAIELIRDNARTSQAVSGWIYVSEISNSYRIDESDMSTDG